MEVVLGLVDMLDHELSYPPYVAPARCGEEAPMRRNIGVAELLIEWVVRLPAHRHHVPQQAVDDLAHEAEQRVGIGRGQYLVKVQIFLALRPRLPLARGRRRARLDALLERREVLLRQVWHGAGGKFRFERPAYRVDLRYIELRAAGAPARGPERD
jgi:hypothetical protein